MTTKTEALLNGIIAHGGRAVESRATRYRSFAIDLPCRVLDRRLGVMRDEFGPYYLFVTVRGGASLRLRRNVGQSVGRAWDESQVAPESLKAKLLAKGGYSE